MHLVNLREKVKKYYKFNFWQIMCLYCVFVIFFIMQDMGRQVHEGNWAYCFNMVYANYSIGSNGIIEPYNKTIPKNYINISINETNFTVR